MNLQNTKREKMIQKAREFTVPILNVKVSILIGSPLSVESYLQDVHNKVFGHSAPNVVAETFYSTESDADEFLYIALYDDTDIKDSAYNVIHECLHAAHKICTFRGVELDEEFLCYLQGFLINKVFECLNAELMVVTNHQLTAEDTLQ